MRYSSNFNALIRKAAILAISVVEKIFTCGMIMIGYIGKTV